jgi:hypothetical protein
MFAICAASAVIGAQSAPQSGADARPPKWRLMDLSIMIKNAVEPDEWPADRYRMVEPAAIPAVPAAVRDALVRLRCRMPVAIGTKVPGGYVWGEFDHRGQRDLAVICVAGGAVELYMFWAGDAARREMLELDVHNGSLSIGTAADVDRHTPPNSRLDRTMPQTMDHDALQIGCCECCSTFYYRYRGQWFSAPGAD